MTVRIKHFGLLQKLASAPFAAPTAAISTLLSSPSTSVRFAHLEVVFCHPSQTRAFHTDSCALRQRRRLHVTNTPPHPVDRPSSESASISENSEHMMLMSCSIFGCGNGFVIKAAGFTLEPTFFVTNWPDWDPSCIHRFCMLTCFRFAQSSAVDQAHRC